MPEAWGIRRWRYAGRSISSLRARDSSTCTGASNPDAAMPWTSGYRARWPSVISMMTAGRSRSGGTSGEALTPMRLEQRGSHRFRRRRIIVATDVDFTDFDDPCIWASLFGEIDFLRAARSPRVLCAKASGSGLRSVYEDGNDRSDSGSRFFTGTMKPDRQQCQQDQCQRGYSRAAAQERTGQPVRKMAIATKMKAMMPAATISQRSGNMRRRLSCRIANVVVLLAQSFEQCRHMDLIGLVVAGQRVHDDVDADAECHFALARLRPVTVASRSVSAIGPQRPGSGQIV